MVHAQNCNILSDLPPCSTAPLNATERNQCNPQHAALSVVGLHSQRAGGPDNSQHLWPVPAAGFSDLLARRNAQARPARCCAFANATEQ